ncbi:protein REVEILLE 6-like isoform X2 [Wolffia australiana]
MTVEGDGPVGLFPADQSPQSLHQSPPAGMALIGYPPLAPSASGINASSSNDDPSKKIRKPYTITKSRESWTEQEHDKFLEALQLFDRDWKKIEAFVGSKTVIQIRSHAQKYFLKVQKSGTSEHVPPPRPKRKAAHPYPQKASKNVPLLSQSTRPFQASCLLEPNSAMRMDSGATAPSWSQSTSVPPLSSSNLTKDDSRLVGSGVVTNCCSSSTESPSGTRPISDTTVQQNPMSSLRGVSSLLYIGRMLTSRKVMPDFVQVYRFIGSVFDPNKSGHLQKLKEMDPIDAETVMLLMKNLSVNLTSPDFEDHRRLLSSYDVGIDEVKHCGAIDALQASESMNTPFMAKGASS